MASGARASGVVSEIWRIRSREAGGSYRWFEVAVANRLDDPSVGGMALGLTDITERDDLIVDDDVRRGSRTS